MATLLEHAAWPIAVVVIAIVALVLFRPQVAGILARMKSFKAPGGVEAQLDASAQAGAEIRGEISRPADRPAPPDTTGIEAGGTPPESDLYRPIDENTRQWLETSFPGRKDLQLQWLIRFYSAVVVEKAHETTYRLIFGSQLKAMQWLNQPLIAPLAEMRRFYDEGFVSRPDAKPTFEAWYGFLLNAGYILIHQPPTVPEAQIEMTFAGRDFLTWMAARGISPDKPF